MEFKILKTYKGLRLGELKLKHGIVNTPAFVPVATKATVKALSSEDLEKLKVDLLITNTYHLMLKPGAQVLDKLGGINEFSSINTPFMTDSGGFQAFSLGIGTQLGKSKFDYKVKESKQKQERIAYITDEGVSFRSIYDQSKHLLTPKLSIQTQHKIGADIILALDECSAPSSDYKTTKEANIRTHLWAKECFDYHKNNNKKQQALYGIIQGGLFKDLREESAQEINKIGFDGYAIGGSFGKKQMYETLFWITPFLDEKKPRHLLGIGTVEDIFNSVLQGIDTFDCAGPTRIARAGYIHIHPKSGGNLKNKYRIRISGAKYIHDNSKLDPFCSCEMCRRYTKAYLCHLFRSQEFLAYKIASYHNIFFYLDIMAQIRKSIKEKNFEHLYSEWINQTN
ncbi:MAG TPA: tRNA guanosine(34) transglycosylase Tgt [Candidatus Woesearchaeota archaeon]|nr:tRNA guanosine(34) transglycosylase Tgt [Candidatus Woesearchaeota archaeon]